MRQVILYVGGILLLLAVGGYFLFPVLVRKQLDKSLRALPEGIYITYTSLNAGLIDRSLILNNLEIKFSADPEHVHRIVVDRVLVQGMRFWALLTTHRLQLRVLRLEGCSVDLDQYLLDKPSLLPHPELPFTTALLGRVELMNTRVGVHKGGKQTVSLRGGLAIDSMVVEQGLEAGGVKIGAIRLLAEDIHYAISGGIVKLRHLELDSKKALLKVDTLRLQPTMDKLEMGRMKGHQVDYAEVKTEGLRVEGLDVKAVLQHRLVADKISVQKNHVYVFRDRRLPLLTDDKQLPSALLKSLPMVIRVKQVKIGTTDFAYEEFPKKGNKTGMLKIVRLRGIVSPLINHPVAGDPDYITIAIEGSLMGSGTVSATTRIPLREGHPYEVEGAFNDLDVTTLNPAAENLGKIHLESGMLNKLAFWFKMTGEKSTGKIVGEYHDLVVDKLKENSDEKKVDKLKSFFLKKVIIPKDKDRSLSESKRTGKVDYKYEPSRYFSYYLLHSLLVGVKSSFSLGFLLPG